MERINTAIIITLIDEANNAFIYEALKGQTLYEVLAQNGVALSAPCGGRGKCGKCAVTIEYKDRIETCLACQTKVTESCTVRLTASENKILTKGLKSRFETDGGEGLALAVDVGTTTIAAYLMERSSGRELAAVSYLNPQRIHGADVISRISFANGAPEHEMLMQNELMRLLDEATESLLVKASLPKDCGVTLRCLVGNTAMMHIAACLPSAGIAKAPYIPEYTALNIQEIVERRYLFGGCISGYVGADTVAAMLACELDRADDNVLLIDIGTNGEIVLKCGNSYSCCSCAAGPAFEGAHIACGIGAVSGAIDHLRATDKGFNYTTISGSEPVGICGSGLVDAVAYLLEEDAITPAGRMKERFQISDKVYIDPSDIREVQLAKAAIAAGIEILIDRAGIDYDQIDRVLLAGGFGNYIDIHSACRIGLLPSELEGKVITVGNAAGEGAKMLSLSRKSAITAEAIRKKTIYIELSAQPDFEDIYTDNLFM